MNRMNIALCAWVVLTTISQAAVADTWPKLDGGKLSQCSDALEVGKATFNSESFYLYSPPNVPDELISDLVLGPQALDISGGDALEAEESVFDKLPIDGEGAPRSIYWQKSPTFGYRLVVMETPYGWRGDQYSLFVIDGKTKSDEFLSAIKADVQPPKFTAIISGWRPPLIFQEGDSDRYWIADVGQPWQFLADWQIYAIQPGGMTATCTVQFRPTVGKAVNLLPAPVRKLEHLLDQTVGPGADEGTLQQTARLRLDVQDTWANAALRPWTLGTPYNTRQEVDAGLENWANSGSAYRKLYQAIKRQLPLAEQALAGYYQRSFKKSAIDAKSLASYVMDVAIRSHYAFHSERPDSYYSTEHIEPNPWRGK